MDVAVRVSRPISFWHLSQRKNEDQRDLNDRRSSTFTVNFNQAAPFVGSSVTNVQSSVLASRSSSAAGLSTPAFEEENTNVAPSWSHPVASHAQKFAAFRILPFSHASLKKDFPLASQFR